MQKRVLIVHQDPEMILAIRDILDELRRTQGEEFIVRHAKTQKEAEERATDEDFDLVLTSLDIPLDDKTPKSAGEHGKRGQELIRNLRTRTSKISAVLISGHVDDDVYDFTEVEHVHLVRAGKKFAESLAEKVTTSLRELGGGKTHHVDLEIYLNPDRGGCFYQFIREGQTVTKPRLLDVDKKTLTDLVGKSREVHVKDKTWKRELREIGESLLGELFSKQTPNNAEFLSEFRKLEGAVHGLENIRIRFAVEETLHPIALEALKEKDKNDFWMLTTPIYRRLERPIESLGLEQRGLFQDNETRNAPVNILIVDANVSADSWLTDKDRDLDMEIKHLENLEKEVESLSSLFRDLKNKGRNIGEIRIVSQAEIPADTTFKEVVRETLKSGSWHIVHYGGHTHYEPSDDPNDETGFVFFPGTGINSVEPVEISTFAEWLRSCTRFVFLSSCSSAEQAFMFRLAKQGVPAIMGFLWSVQDKKAREFANTFYTYLFDGEEQSLEFAYWRAKVDMYTRHKNNPIWAAPVLVKEVGLEEPRYAA